MTPCEELGYEVGDLFKFTYDKGPFPLGSTVRLIIDDGTRHPRFEGVDCKADHGCGYHFAGLYKVEKIKETQDMIAKADGKPYATYESAKQQLSAKGLGDTHEVVEHRGGYGIAPKASGLEEPSEHDVYAVPQVGCDYITAGKMYRVVREDVLGMFYAEDDDGDKIACLWEGCAHLGGGSWRRVEVELITLRPGDYVSTKGMTEEQYHAVAEAFMAAEAGGGEYPNWNWASDESILPNFGWFGGKLYHGNGEFAGRQLTISQVLNSTNAKRVEEEPQHQQGEAEAAEEAQTTTLDTLRLAQQRVNEAAYELSIAQAVRDESLAAVRAELGEGFEISVAEGVPAGVDMSDPANWREGDLLEALHGVNRIDIHAGGVYEFLKVDYSGDIRVKADDEGDSNWCHARDIKFHSRPTR